MITQHVLEIRRLNSSKIEAAEKTTNDDRVDVDALVNRSVLFFVQFFLSLVCIRYHLLRSNLNICALCIVVSNAGSFTLLQCKHLVRSVGREYGLVDNSVVQ